MVLLPVPFYVLLSSWIGLTGKPSFPWEKGAASFFGSVWQANIGADVLFALGSAGVCFGSLFAVAYACRRMPPGWPGFVAAGAAGLSILLNWLVYGLSFMAMFPDWWQKNISFGDGGNGMNFPDSMRFVWDWAWPTLVFFSLVIPLVFWGILELVNASRRKAGTPPGWTPAPPGPPYASRPTPTWPPAPAQPAQRPAAPWPQPTRAPAPPRAPMKPTQPGRMPPPQAPRPPLRPPGSPPRAGPPQRKA
ncbi:MAG: hypothetical protein V4510_03530 [bacterium]